MLSAAPTAPGWGLTTATVDGEVDAPRAALHAEVRLSAELRLRAGGPTLGLLVPSVLPLPEDTGGLLFAAGWTVEAVEDASGAALTWTVPEEDTDARYDTRPDRRLVVVRWAAPPARGEERVLRVRWRQRLPFARADLLPSGILRSGDTTPVLPLVPVPVGDPARVPWGARLTTPDDVRVLGPGGEALAGRAAGAAAVVAGRWAVDTSGPVRLYTDDAGAGVAERARQLDGLLAGWAGRGLSRIGLVQLPGAFAPPRVAWAEGLAGVSPSVWADTRKMAVDGGTRALPLLETVLAAEGMAAASWADRAGADPEGRGWVTALARAFAVDQLSGTDAGRWRRWMRDCALDVRGANPGLSPASAGRSGWRDTAGRCAGPLIVGPMLDDRLGAADARAVRHALLAAGPTPLDLTLLRALVLAYAPDAGAWVDRWLASGEAARLTVDVEAVDPAGDGWVVRGVLRADHPLGGAPVEVLFRGGGAEKLVGVRAGDRDTPFAVTLPFRPRHLEVDPRRRLLAQVGGRLPR